MVDFNNLLSRFVLAAPRALNDEVAQGQMVVCTQMSIAGSAASFTVKIIMNAGTGRDLAEQLAQPLIKGLLGLTASAAELAAATQAEQSVLQRHTLLVRLPDSTRVGGTGRLPSSRRPQLLGRGPTRPTRAVPDLPRQGRSRFSEPRLLSRCFASCLPLGQWPLVMSRRPKC